MHKQNTRARGRAIFCALSMDSRRGAKGGGAVPRIQKGGFVQEFRLENRSYLDVHDFSLRMQVIIANDYRLHLTCAK